MSGSVPARHDGPTSSVTLPTNVIDLPARADDRTQREIIAQAAAVFAKILTGGRVPAQLPTGDRDPQAPLLRCTPTPWWRFWVHRSMAATMCSTRCYAMKLNTGEPRPSAHGRHWSTLM
ncbi:hypothetical protein KUA19_30115 [Catellatospora sp. NEAU-YM18]|nr:hypothetical protein [Catellatospora tritici]